MRIVRYDDDICARDKKTVGSYKSYVTKILEEELKLRVNERKTKLINVYEGVGFLGVVVRSKNIRSNPKRIKRFKANIKNFIKKFMGWLRRRLSMVRMIHIKRCIRR